MNSFLAPVLILKERQAVGGGERQAAGGGGESGGLAVGLTRGGVRSKSKRIGLLQAGKSNWQTVVFM